MVNSLIMQLLCNSVTQRIQMACSMNREALASISWHVLTGALHQSASLMVMNCNNGVYLHRFDSYKLICPHNSQLVYFIELHGKTGQAKHGMLFCELTTTANNGK